ncbi:MAG: hypothetical protein K0Q99_1749, partial [Clostridia bacterium]|nr:hypothetical protein [Clostridia bacterium]
VNIQGETEEMIKLMVVKGKEQNWYDVKLDKGKFDEQLWLNKGTGKYDIYIMVNEYDRKYSFGPKLTVENTKELNPFLIPDKDIESEDKLIVEKSQEITKGLNRDTEKIKAIYDWVSENIEYDYAKYRKHLNNDYDNQYGALLALQTQKGVCYDYAALVAALGRAAGIQSKLVKGTGVINGTSGYHAWNEVYLADESKWIKLDATYAAVLGENYFNNEGFDESHRIEQIN